MGCHSNKIRGILMILFMGQFIWGCVSLQIEKFNDGADIPPPPDEFMAGKHCFRKSYPVMVRLTRSFI
jgi:hypothetical protein